MLTITLNPALDVCAAVTALEPDRKMRCRDVIVEPGGGGVNVARVAVRLGARATALVFVADDCDQRFFAMLAADGVPVEAVAGGGPLRENLTVVERSTSRQYRFVFPGPEMESDLFNAGLLRIAELSADELLVVVSGSAPPGVSVDDVAHLVATVRDCGVEVIADTSGDALLGVAKIGVALLKPSARELADFIGEPVSSHAEIEQVARQLLAAGPNRAVLVSIGSSGALLVRPSETTLWFHAPRVQSLSTVGAGDSLVGGIAAALERDENLVDAVRFGVAAGTAATLTVGTGLCSVADVERLLPQVLVTGIAT